MLNNARKSAAREVKAWPVLLLVAMAYLIGGAHGSCTNTSFDQYIGGDK